MKPIKEIELTQGKFAIVDDEDYDRLNQYKWRYSTGYAMRAVWTKNKQIAVLMHREVIGARPEFEVDHINRKRLDNRKENLRECTRSQNACNKPRIGKVSKYRGVSKYGKSSSSWISRIKTNGKLFYIGSFKEEKEAAKKYNEYAIKFHGEFAILNDV